MSIQVDDIESATLAEQIEQSPRIRPPCVWQKLHEIGFQAGAVELTRVEVAYRGKVNSGVLDAMGQEEAETIEIGCWSDPNLEESEAVSGENELAEIVLVESELAIDLLLCHSICHAGEASFEPILTMSEAEQQPKGQQERML
jgi:hypothetical protein